jgi:hypothetical protein
MEAKLLLKPGENERKELFDVIPFAAGPIGLSHVTGLQTAVGVKLSMAHLGAFHLRKLHFY